MAALFFPGQTLGPDDLSISIRNSFGALVDPESIYYTIFDFTTGREILMGNQHQMPASPTSGIFYAPYMIPLDANLGDWVVRWDFKERGSDIWQQVAQALTVAKREAIQTSVTQDTTERLLIRRLRILLRDNNPDRNYRFRPPNTEKYLQSQTEVFGYIWTDEELFEYLLMAADDINSRPPATGITLENHPTAWRTAIILRAASFACMAVTMNWIADEFDYSIGGVSLNIDKSSKYQSMKENFEQQYDSAVEALKRTVKIIKGLQQPKYGIGISSALGPFSRDGVQSRRNYIGG